MFLFLPFLGSMDAIESKINRQITSKLYTYICIEDFFFPLGNSMTSVGCMEPNSPSVLTSEYNVSCSWNEKKKS